MEREFVAAQIDEWTEGSVCPKAPVIRMLGRAKEIKPQISAVLFEHAIRAADFSPESLSCLRDAPWKIPPEEYDVSIKIFYNASMMRKTLILGSKSKHQ
ncbi:RNB [Musa troglodytarum]|uniref:RNB n=1 Tax=Musa troglodytarum TaxID=320322 RepID=A0A9E7K4X4_9LILI|nr:RNB [Musa troglodytarum]